MTRKDDCTCSDTDNIASLTEVELDKFIQDVSDKVLKVADKTTKKKKRRLLKK